MLRLALVLIFCLSAITPTDAQLPLRHRSPVEPEILLVQPLQYFPPLTSDMPYDVLVSWIVLDSLCKTATFDQLKTYLRSTSDDTVKQAVKFFYMIMDYNYLLLLEYNDNIRSDTAYKLSPSSAFYALKAEYADRFGAFSYTDEDVLLFGRIYVATVEAIQSFPDTIVRQPVTRYIASLGIDSIIKGRVLIDECIEGSNQCSLVEWIYQDSTKGLFQEWSKQFPPNVLEVGSQYLIYVRDIANDNPKDGLRPYLTSLSWVRDENNDGSRGVFKINNGLVDDKYQYFKMGSAPAYHDAIGMLRTSVNKFMNR